MSDDNASLNWFRHAAPYINDLRGRTLVIGLPGDALEHANFRNLVHDLTLLVSLGARLVVVHGARAQINRALAERGIANQFHGNTRVTDRETLEVIKAAVGKLRFELEAAFSQGLPDSPMARSALKVVSGNFITARPIGVLDGVDLRWTGTVRRMEVKTIQHALEQGALVLLSPLGTSLTGELFNLNYLDLASEAARALQAEKLVLFREAPQLSIDGERVTELSIVQAEQITSRVDSAALRCAIAACNAGTPRTHLLSYAQNGALIQELFRREGAGTMIYRDSYEVIRRARITDVGGILGLIRPLETQGILVRRPREKLEAEIDHFTLVEVDGTPVACAALYPIHDEQGQVVAAELACVAIHPDFRGSGRGAKLLRHLERQAGVLGINELFVLTTQTEHWFIEQGFNPATAKDLPASRQSLYNIQRNSRVLRKRLHP
ncbi:amino-acid N-acetyltransferase [Microbulbifer thermotolerans]|uniref:Amino-acid acetyltransferase n=1 Tax=Microbulbifer thermotolerans TaxID=252514 RepID=A0AB35HXH6_MICTH|nr:amino-acid N-acetyltransferase [Microbulbifer thermotolerans]MCX2778158.1 amino-acid N-acetyltransferase [Microbulbifer thermotolerans]MCX2795300.1 amino-acid N-acetyltransferase [Microbulbifer thermotolerans]MCX2801138.1 amino-acid N-acetyltransferase [Microbulbifer thermotolerans]MCX2804506.1 amino-acid N-acetyltransferase [Microbulbifer thermotolerans]MCX2831287.1 amino-acid N-acetyltransferase [Microbulbifer thermotolerans]